ncbi:restriction endonuclease [Sorangium sp. So ce1097]|uniref:restriction endonuclease n=1 Tax=Sorangium sp. So ce1097 TaxID=3133330 RepID=UPI003F61A876
MSEPPIKQDPFFRVYERLVAVVQAKLSPVSDVRWNVWRRAASGARRNIDVLVEGKGDDAALKVAIEVKYREKKIGIKMVGDFYTAITGIGATKGIMVSSVDGHPDPQICDPLVVTPGASTGGREVRPREGWR